MTTSVKTKIYSEDAELLKKAGLDKSGIIELRAIRIENDRTFRREQVRPDGSIISSDEMLGNSFDLEDEKVTLATVAFAGTSNIKGYWKQGLNEREIKRLQERYSLPDYSRGHKEEPDTLFTVYDGMVLDLDNLIDHCIFNVLKHNPSIHHNKSECTPHQPFYWVLREDLKKQKKDRINAQKEIYKLVFGPEAMDNRAKALCWEYVQYMRQIPHKQEETEEDYVWSLEDAVTDHEQMVVIKDYVKQFNTPNGIHLLVLKRLENMGDVFTRSLGGAEREYYVRTPQGETRVASSLSEMITYIKHSRNTALYEKGERYSPFQQMEVIFAQNETGNIDKALGITERSFEEEEFEQEDSEDFEDDTTVYADYAPAKEYTPAKLSKEKMDVLDKLILSAYDDKAITEAEYLEYSEIKSITSKRSYIKQKFNIK